MPSIVARPKIAHSRWKSRWVIAALLSLLFHVLLLLLVSLRPDAELDDEGEMVVSTIYDTPAAEQPVQEEIVDERELIEPLHELPPSEERAEVLVEEDEPEAEQEEEPPPEIAEERVQSVVQPEYNHDEPPVDTYLAEHDNVAEVEMQPEEDQCAPLSESETPEVSEVEDDEPSAEPEPEPEELAAEPEPQVPVESEDIALEVPQELVEEELVNTPELAEQGLVAERAPLQLRAPEESVAERMASIDPDAYLAVFEERDRAEMAAAAAREELESWFGSAERDWDSLREALLNHDIRVQTGTEMHLSTRSDASAAYINYLHDKIHQRWPLYLRALDVRFGPNDALSNPSLMTAVEFGVSSQGEVVHAGIVRSSGQAQFDGEALLMVRNLGPHRPPPPGLLSHDGNLYVHWQFHRDQRMCGTFGASVRIIRSPDEQVDGG